MLYMKSKNGKMLTIQYHKYDKKLWVLEFLKGVLI